MERFRHAVLVLVFLARTAMGQPHPLTLTQNGAPIPGPGPVGIAVADTNGGGTYAVIADFSGNQVRSFRIDRSTGALSPVGAVPLANGPAAVAVAPGGRYALVTTLRGNDVTSYSIDRSTGALTPIGAVPTGGSGPVNLDVTSDGYAVIANKDSDSLGVVRIDRSTGALSPVGAVTVGNAPNDIKLIGRQVVVGHALSNDVHLLHLDQFGALYPLDVRSVGASRVTAISTIGPIAVAGTFAGEVHAFFVAGGQLRPLGSAATGGDITDITISDRGTLFVAGGIPGRVSAFELDHRLRLREVGTLPFPGVLTSRTMATVRGRGQTTYVISNELQGNQTVVISATR